MLADGYAWNLLMDECNKTMAFAHGDLLFVFNWHPSASIPDYELPVQAPGKYVPLLSTDERRFGGQERQAMDGEHFSFPAQDGDNTERPHIRIYNTSRTATVYLRTDGRQPSADAGDCERSGERTRPVATARKGSKRPGGNRNGTAMENPIAVKGSAGKQGRKATARRGNKAAKAGKERGWKTAKNDND